MLHIVLVRTKYSSNIGSAARAGANMGASQLHLVNPQCSIDLHAHQAAAGSQQLLDNVKTYINMREFHLKHSNGIKIALTRRAGKHRGDRLLSESLRSLSKDPDPSLTSNCYFIFGPEDHGLSNDDMGLVHWRCQLPIYGEFPSLNLAQSVLLTLYIAQNEFHKGLQKSSSEALQETQSPSLKSNEAFPDSLLEEWLTLLGFNLSSKKRNALITLKRLLLNNLPGKDESSTLRAIIYQTVRKLKKLDK